MRLEAFIESDSFQIAVRSGNLIPQWTEENLSTGVADSEEGLLIATYPDIEFRNRSIPVTIMDAGEDLTAAQQKEFHLIGEYHLLAQHKSVDVGCIPSVCEGTSGRVNLDRKKFSVQVWGSNVQDPKKILLRFKRVHFTGIDAGRLKV